MATWRQVRRAGVAVAVAVTLAMVVSLVPLGPLGPLGPGAPAVARDDPDDPDDPDDRDAVNAPADVRLPAGKEVRGRWDARTAAAAAGARSTATGTELVWRAPSPLPVTGARPELRVRSGGGPRVVAVPALGADGRTLTVGLHRLAGVDTSELQVWLGADRLDRVGGIAPAYARSAGTGGGGGGIATAAVEELAADPGARGPRTPQPAFDYAAPRLPWREFNRPMEVAGHVLLPRGVDDAPLVLLLHGRHQACYGRRGDEGAFPCGGPKPVPVPSQLGYDYLQRRLATQGYASVSIAANAINLQDFRSFDGGATARSALVRHHLRLIADWADDPGRPRWFGRVDVDRTVLVGHSRGGEGVARAVLDTRRSAPYEVLGQVLVAPTNFARTSTPFAPTATLLPYCDGDVIDLQGQAYTDVGRDLGAGDRAFRSSVLMRGANHNFFNTEWTPGIAQAPSFDDWFDRDHRLCGSGAETRLSAAEQRTAGTSWVAAAVRLFADAERRMLGALDAAGAVTVPSLPGGAVWTHAVGGARTLLRPAAGASASGAAALCRAASAGVGAGHRGLVPTVPDCGAGLFELRGLHWFGGAPRGLPLPRQVRLGWAAPGVRGGLRPATPLDVSADRATLDLRVAVDPREGPVDLAVRVVDADGTGWTAPAVRLPVLGVDFLRTWWAQTVRVDLDAAPLALDRSAVQRVELVGRSAAGQVWLLDVAARRPAVVPVTGRYVPQLSLRRRTVVDEGDRPRTFEVPWRLDARAPVAGRFALVAAHRRSTEVVVVRVPAGATRGVVEVRYPSDRVDDRRRTFVQLVAVPLRDVVPERTDGLLVVRDDDP